MRGLHSGFFSIFTAGCDAMCMGGKYMHVPTSETYGDVRNLGVKVQGNVGWYATVYTSLSQYMAGYF